jgi:hypothetical protein
VKPSEKNVLVARGMPPSARANRKRSRSRSLGFSSIHTVVLEFIPNASIENFNAYPEASRIGFIATGKRATEFFSIYRTIILLHRRIFTKNRKSLTCLSTDAINIETSRVTSRGNRVSTHAWMREKHRGYHFIITIRKRDEKKASIYWSLGNGA